MLGVLTYLFYLLSKPDIPSAYPKITRSNSSDFLWSHLGLNQGPPDYESGATNQLSYRTPAIELSFTNYQTRLQRYYYFLK